MNPASQPTKLHKGPLPPQGYPFLAIAKKFNVDYSDVLKHADYLTFSRPGSKQGYPYFPYGSPVDFAIADAIHEQTMVRDGYIDWQTGEPKNPDPRTPAEAGVYA